uniref:Uncharacterized protein n=1 Tax=viral metagenome TaxID=1070528 RepID=A0A6M3XWR3_9ZZZZ
MMPKPPQNTRNEPAPLPLRLTYLYPLFTFYSEYPKADGVGRIRYYQDHSEVAALARKYLDWLEQHLPPDSYTQETITVRHSEREYTDDRITQLVASYYPDSDPYFHAVVVGFNTKRDCSLYDRAARQLGDLFH